jgi:hypothetical protein
VSTYASSTGVSVESSKAEIERTLQRYGASSFMSGWDAERAVIGFMIAGRQIRFVLTLPDRNDHEYTQHSRGQRTPEAAFKAWEQACRQRWRALSLVIKAKLEAVESGITSIEDEFLAHTVLPNGSTMGEWARPQVARAYETGDMPSSLLALGAGS